MALGSRRNGRNRRPTAHAKEERGLFPVWTLIVIALCAALWVGGAKLYSDRMAAYEAYAAISKMAAQDTFFPGVTVDGIDLGGMTRDEAHALFADRQMQTASAFSLVVASGEKRWRITSQEVPVTFNADTILEQAYNVGHTGTLEQRVSEIQRARDEGVVFVTGYTYERSAVRALVDTIADSLDVAAKDATLDAFDPNNHTFTFTKESAGYRVDRELLHSDILAALDERA